MQNFLVVLPFVALIQACAFTVYFHTNQCISFILQNIDINVDHIAYFNFVYAFSDPFVPHSQFRRTLPEMVKGSNVFNERRAKMGDLLVSTSKWQILCLLSALCSVFSTTISAFDMAFYFDVYRKSDNASEAHNTNDTDCINTIEFASGPFLTAVAAIMIGGWYAYSVAIHPKTASVYSAIESETMKLKYLEINNKYNDLNDEPEYRLMQTNIAQLLNNTKHYYVEGDGKSGCFSRYGDIASSL